MTIDLNKLEQLCDKATQGKWVRNRSFGQLSIQDDDFLLHDEDAEFIAAANPSTIKALISELKQAREDARRYRQLRDEMGFYEDSDKQVFMKMISIFPAPHHNLQTDWLGERFDASVDETLDAAMQSQSPKQGEE